MTSPIHNSIPLALAALAALASCSNDGRSGSTGSRYMLGSVVIDPDNARKTYVQTLDSLDDGPFDNKTAIEIPGNGVVMARGRSFFIGLADEPTWIRYEVGVNGPAETGRLSFLNLGATYIDYGNAFVDDQTAVSVFSKPPVAVVWNPTTMEITGQIDLGFLTRAGYELEVWTTVAYQGRVYVPGRFADWMGERILQHVSLTILDPKARTVIATAEDDRCASGGQVVFDAAGYGYVMGDGRTDAIHMFANANGGTPPANCLLRIPPGGTDFEAGYYYTIPSLTGGLETVGELGTAKQGSGLGVMKMFYPDHLPPGRKADSFDYWSDRAFKNWRLRLADPPVAEEVHGLPFAAIGFTGTVVGDHMFTGESLDGGATSEVYETDPATNTARVRFTMDGDFYGLYELSR
jgi:hypothetical protein